ncbi:helix-hairpin-helix domain-containing protein [Arthrobacter celericrescens]|uniref:helix-hairpin-helix domain-containing protein n=1 Tax=Arthrobacter celericrescens TaxID=2320851 RepID=UPI000EA3741A|nr:helix-hairpin-helix domain-containing protein [Arthrobacter celericrescens]
MPRRNQDPLAGDAARAARHRLRSRLGVAETVSGAEGPGDDLLLPGRESSTLQDLDWNDAQTGRTSRVRWRVPWRVPALLLIPALLLALWIGWQAWAGRPPAEQLAASDGTPADVSSPAPPGAEPGSAGPGAGDSGGTRIVVHVAGAVKKPGIVSLPAGSRVFEAIAAAGGAASGSSLDSLNLAAVVQDGTRIHVPRKGEEPATAGAGGSSSATDGTTGGGTGSAGGAGARININTASAAELDELPRVGPVLAERIVAWREEHGPFAAVEELDAVDGVGPKMLEALLPLVTV